MTDQDSLDALGDVRRSLSPLDHRKLGQKLSLFAYDAKIGKGLPLWLPNGTVIREELEKYAKELEFKAGFRRVATPHLARTELYHDSGHLPYFARDMYPLLEVFEEGEDGGETAKDSYALKPMNCPHHHRVFAAEPRSYRDLPLRLAEYGQVYRWERSGALSGLARVRGMCMNDGHIYCTAEQVEQELHAVLDMYAEVYALLGIDGARFRLSLRDPGDARDKYVDDKVSWAWAEALLRSVLERRGIDYEDGLGHAAFYGPKIDIQVRTLAGTEETLSTVQLDFAQPQRLGLAYIAPSGRPAAPYCIHRAPLSTHERFVAFLVELYGGALPTWLAPVQSLVVPVSDAFRGYGEEIVRRLRASFVRAELAAAGETVARGVRDAAEKKIPNVLVVGKRERDNRSVTLRRHGSERQESLSVDDFERLLLAAIAARSRTLGVSVG
ncbi:MAG TPA: threonine--tRNA ligase [Gammaproteobacteria bacterium]|nr:threonine--tRNA ligase [Gammaproteobacteria bacterium]